jgi:hypothetical protein
LAVILKKQFMKWLLLSLLFLVCAGVDCEKGDLIVYQAQGTLQRVDMALCPCCGGVVLQYNNDSTRYRIDSLPFMSVQQLQALPFPKTIQFNYSDSTVCGGIVRLKVSAYQLGN